ncbi:hypothetical protein DL96DRAFT_1617739 [Flagelloscypha sp. PMI_526]|nr:hypothetical protein DL96DRAFT_1617739 [Flagelloscypha sp. PMI_526]
MKVVFITFLFASLLAPSFIMASSTRPLGLERRKQCTIPHKKFPVPEIIVAFFLNYSCYGSHMSSKKLIQPY